MNVFFERLTELLSANEPFVCVTIVDASGSVPQEIGAKMLVTGQGLYYGTVGGGKVEVRALAEALKMLQELAPSLSTRISAEAPGERTPGEGQPDEPANIETGQQLEGQSGSDPGQQVEGQSRSDPGQQLEGQSRSDGAAARDGSSDKASSRPAGIRFVQWSLDRDIGMTCGGSVKLYFEAFNLCPWRITVFGAGHCALALVTLLSSLDCQITCYDPRPEWLDRMPGNSKVKRIVASDMPAKVREIPAGSFVLLMTMGHTTDMPILLEILRNWQERQFPYLGVIGSKAKAARLFKDIAQAGLPEQYNHLFHCPMGLPVGGNRPEEIAVSVAAQLLQERDRVHDGRVLS